MTVGAFELMDAGLLAHQDSSIDPGIDAMYAVLIDTVHGAPDVATEALYSDISADENSDGDYSPQDVILAVSEPSPGIVMVDMTQVDFGDTVSIASRYFYVLKGAEGAPLAGDLILGFMDLNDGGTVNIQSVDSDFKVDAGVNGLYRTTKAP